MVASNLADAKSGDPDTTISPIEGGVRAGVGVANEEPGYSGEGSGPRGNGVACTYTALGGNPVPDLDYPGVQPVPGSTSKPYKYRCSDGSTGVVWIMPGPGGGGGVPVDPRVLAQQATSDLILPEPQIRMNPDPEESDAITQFPLWLWVDESTWGDRSKTASVPGVAVTAMASAERVTFDMGNGDQVVCEGPGTPYDPSRPEADQGTDCGYTYRHTSAGQPDQRFQVTATVAWRVTWTVSGAPAPANPDLGHIERSSSVAIRVAEVQSINQSWG